MNHARGFLMLAASAVAFWRGSRIHAAGHSPWLAIGLGVLALAMAIWHFTRKPDQPKR
jgi:ABC-type nickel/cobalt efflux system permease component RcnA